MSESTVRWLCFTTYIIDDISLVTIGGIQSLLGIVHRYANVENPCNPLKSQQFQILPSDGTVSLRLILFSSYCGRDFIPAWDRTLVLQHREALYRAGGGPRTGKGKISQIQNLLDYIYIQSYWNCEVAGFCFCILLNNSRIQNVIFYTLLCL